MAANLGMGRDMERVERVSLALSAGAAAAGYALVSPHFALSLAAGAVFETANVHHLIRSTRSIFEGSGGRAGGFRFALVLLFVAAALFVGAHPVGLLIGISLVMPVLIFEAWRNRPPILADAPAVPGDDPSWDLWNPWLAREQDPVDDDEEGEN